MTVSVAHRGFPEPVANAQTVFRAVMNALARPGVAQPLSGVLCLPPPPLTAELAAVALALIDGDAPFWLSRSLAGSPEVARYLTFQTGSLQVGDPADAAFALALVGDPLPALAKFAQGTDEYPDRSTTLVVAIASHAGGPMLTLRGPGIECAAPLCASGLPDGLATELAANRTRFPRGIDLLLVAPEGVVGLPRTTAVLEG